MLADLFGVMLSPRKFWSLSAGRTGDARLKGMSYIAVVALASPIAFYYGTTVQGWAVGERVIKISPESGLVLAILFYLTLISVTVTIGLLISWMAQTYNAVYSASMGIETAGLCATPIYLAGIAAAYPVFWFDLLLGTAACAHGAYLLNLAIPARMQLPEERAFLYTSAIFAAGLVLMIAVMGATTFAWQFISAPVFIE